MRLLGSRIITATISPALLSACCGCGGDSSKIATTREKPLAHIPAATLGVHGGQLKSLGSHRIELRFEPKSGTFSLNAYRADALEPQQIDSPSLTVQVTEPERDGFIDVALAPDDAAAPSSFTGRAEPAAGALRVAAVVKAAVNGKTHRAMFHFDQSKPLIYVCPMGCEGAGIHPQPGECPVCQMKMVNHAEAHSDHSPKHGGVFFMAPDNWHHLEGVLVSGEFRIYLYNNFTRPISSKPFASRATIDVAMIDSSGNEVSLKRGLAMTSADDGAFLTIALPKELRPPLAITAYIRLRENDKSPALFNFSFK